MRRKVFGIAAVVVSLAMLTTACSGPDNSSNAKSGTKQITIGLMAPITGDSAADGQGMKQGFDQAIKELNAKGGVAGYTFKTQVIDTQNLQSDAVASGAQTLIADPNVKAVLTSYASANNFEIETFGRAKMPYLVDANADQTEAIIKKSPSAYPTVWSLVPAYAPYGTELPKVIEKWDAEGKITLRDKSAFVITSDNPFSQGISKGLISTLKKRGWNVKGEETVPFGSVNDWGSILSKVRSANPDLIIDTDYLPANEATFLKQFDANPSNSIVFMQYGPSIPEFLQLTKDNSNGILYNLLGDPIRSEKFVEGTKIFNHLSKAFGTADVNNQAVVLYEEVMLYADALKKVGDPDKKEAIGKAIGSSTTVTAFGTLSFDPKTHLAVYGDDNIPLQFLQIQNGKRVEILPTKYSDGEFQTPPWYKK